MLNYYELAGINQWVWLGIEFGFFVFFFGAAYLALAYMRHVRR